MPAFTQQTAKAIIYRMANKQHLSILRDGVDVWNKWREDNPGVKPDLVQARLGGYSLSGANLHEADFMGAWLEGLDLRKSNLSEASLMDVNLDDVDLRGANLTGADLFRVIAMSTPMSHAILTSANLSFAQLDNIDLEGAKLVEANMEFCSLRYANLTRAKLMKANLSNADLIGTIFSFSDLTGSDLRLAKLVNAKLDGANISDSSVFGISAWNLNLDGTVQSNLRVTHEEEATITVDNIEVAQFIYLLLNNQRVRHIIDTLTTKVVLILGRFTRERKDILEALRDELRRRDYLPILFDFEKPASRDITETISTLAHLARFVIADITDAKSIPQELQQIVPDLPSVPVQPLLLASEDEYGMFEHFKRYPWVLEPYVYESQKDLLANIKERVIEPAEATATLTK